MPRNVKDITDAQWMERVEFIIAEFDFKKVKKVMKFLNWEWCPERTDGEETRVPSKKHLKITARGLLWEVIESLKRGNSFKQIGTGGFEARGAFSEAEGEALELRFVLCDVLADL